MNENKNMMDMTKGDPLKLILVFAIPIFLGNIFQQLYNIVDTMIAGHTLGDSALSAIGATSSLYGLLVFMAVGMGGGFAIVVSRMYGEKNEDKLRNSIALTIVLSVAVAAVLTVFSLVFIVPLLKLIQTPADILNEAYSYISIILAGIPITVAFNTESAVLRAVGDSKTPLYFLIISTIINIILDYVLIVFCHLGVRGAALATIIAQAISAILCLYVIYRNFPELHLHKNDFHFEKPMVVETFMMGVSMGLMSSIVSIGSVILQGAINTLGTDTIAAHLVARKIDEMLMLPLMTFATACSTFVAQNYGAKEYERIHHGIKQSIVFGVVYSIIAEVVILLGAELLVKGISGSNNSYIIATAKYYLNINIPFFIALDILFVLRTSLQGMGQKIIPIISSVVELSCKFIAAMVLTPTLGYLGVCVAEPLSWCAMALFLTIGYLVVRKKLLTATQA